jgi:hypothetical protein
MALLAVLRQNEALQSAPVRRSELAKKKRRVRPIPCICVPPLVLKTESPRVAGRSVIFSGEPIKSVEAFTVEEDSAHLRSVRLPKAQANFAGDSLFEEHWSGLLRYVTACARRYVRRPSLAFEEFVEDVLYQTFRISRYPSTAAWLSSMRPVAGPLMRVASYAVSRVAERQERKIETTGLTTGVVMRLSERHSSVEWVLARLLVRDVLAVATEADAIECQRFMRGEIDHLSEAVIARLRARLSTPPKRRKNRAARPRCVCGNCGHCQGRAATVRYRRRIRTAPL